jgi:hypothetical protein
MALPVLLAGAAGAAGWRCRCCWLALPVLLAAGAGAGCLAAW